MTQNNFYIFTILYSVISISLLHYLWKRVNNSVKVTSSGSGYGLVVLLNLIIFLYSYENFYFFFIFLIISSIYLIDDFKTLNFKIRILLQIILGFIIAYSFNDLYEINYFLLILICVFLAFTLTNLINFNDGDDLHISLFITVFLLVQYYLNDNLDQYLKFILINCIIFFVVFSFFNFRKITFFGDCGCFISSGLILYLLFSDLSLQNICFTLICFSFYFIDTTTFLVIRLKKKENLLTRNFYHIYQNMSINFKGYYYLIPGLLNTLSLLLIFYFYNQFIFKNYDIFLIFFITSLNYYIFRVLFYK